MNIMQTLCNLAENASLVGDRTSFNLPSVVGSCLHFLNRILPFPRKGVHPLDFFPVDEIFHYIVLVSQGTSPYPSAPIKVREQMNLEAYIYQRIQSEIILRCTQFSDNVLRWCCVLFAFFLLPLQYVV